MSVETGSKWVKDGKVVEIFEICSHYTGHGYTICVWFKDIKNEIHVLTEGNFLRQYKPYEAVYEYRYCFSNECSYDISSRYFTDEEIKPNHWIKYQRLDFTKRERK